MSATHVPTANGEAYHYNLGGRPRPSAGHPFHARCGSHHPGGDAGCWMLNMNLVPSRMAHMYAGLHAKRANPPLTVGTCVALTRELV